MEKPEIPFGLGWYFNAYIALDTCRSVGMSEGSIPWTAVNDYALRNHLTDKEFDELWKVVRGMDVAYHKFRAENSKPPKDRIGPTGKPPTRGR